MIRRVAIVALLAAACAAYGQGWDLLGALWTEPSGVAVDLTSNLQHYWYGANGTNDAGAGGKNLINVTSVGIGTNGFDFGTANHYLKTSGPISNGTAYTVCLLSYPNKTAMDLNTFGGWMLSDRGDQNGIDWQMVYPKSVFNANYSDSTSGGNFLVVNGCVPTNNVWHHLAWVVDYSVKTQKLYVNGAFFAGEVATNVPNNGSVTDFTIGTASWVPGNAGLAYHGLLDRIRFYSTAKDAAFIQAVYNADKAAKGL